MRTEERDEWVQRKKQKPRWGKPVFKQYGDEPINLKKGIRKRATGFYEIKGSCPCATCNHEVSWDCDPNGGMEGTEGCLCCSEVCS